MSTAANPPVSEPSLSQLLDALERTMDSIAKGDRQSDSRTINQIDGVISRIPDIFGRAKNVRNSLVPINRLPPETLALIATFFEPTRQLIDATAVCKHWRETLLSFPRPWGRINCPTRAMFETYLKRPKSAPLEVQLHNTSLDLFELLAPHVSRLSSLTLVMHNPSGFGQLARHLGNPIPTLKKFGIFAAAGGDKLSIHSSIRCDHFLHVKKLRLVHVSFLRAPHAFPHVTELEWITTSHSFKLVSGLLETLVELPTLERVEIEFLGFSRSNQATLAHPVTLPNVQMMSLHTSCGEIPDLLEFLKLPSLTSLVVDGIWSLYRPFVIFPVSPFSENIPNFAQLPEMEVATHYQQNRVSFRSPSQATLDYYVVAPPSQWGFHRHSCEFWGGLPVDSIRKLVVDMRTADGDDEWVVSLLGSLGYLEDLEFRAPCGHTPRYLRQMIMEGNHLLKCLAVYFGSEREARQVYRLEDVVDGLDSGISVTWVKHSWTSDEEEREPKSDGASAS